MAYTTINKSTDYFNTVLWTTDGTGNKALTTGHSTDMVWIKFRDYAYDHRIYDDVRGVTKKIIPNKTDAESTTTDLASFDTNGFTVGSNLNTSGEGGLVGWSWKANGSGSSNTDGSITSTVSANTTSGFSIVTYTGTGSNATIGHGLGAVPSMIIFKNLDGSSSRMWAVYHKGAYVSASDPNILYLNTSNAQADDTNVLGTSVTLSSSVFSVGDYAGSNYSGENIIAYVFAEKKGFSKFGSYTGNGSTDGTFVYTGFKPAFLIIKRTNAGNDWVMLDSKRDPINQMGKGLFPMSNSAEATGYSLDFLSNGFKLRTSGSGENGSGAPFIFMAFAEAPLVGSNNVPCTAR